MGGSWKHEKKCETHAQATFNIKGEEGFGSGLDVAVAGIHHLDDDSSLKAKVTWDGTDVWLYPAYIHRFNKHFKLTLGDKVS